MVDRPTPDAAARPPDPRRLIPELSEEERRQRPSEVRPLTFEDMVSPTHHFRVVRFLVPIESVRAGDDQVFAARWPRQPRESVIDLDGLLEYPSVRSVVVSS